METMRKVRNSGDEHSPSGKDAGAALDLPAVAGGDAVATFAPAETESGLAVRQRILIDKPGIYRDFDGEAYFADPCPEPSLTQSIAKILLDQSPAHAALEHPRLGLPLLDGDEEAAEKYVKAQAIGNAAHKLVLGRGKDVEIIDAPDFKKQAARDLRDAATFAGRVPILAKHMLEAELMQVRLRNQLRDHEEGDAFKHGAAEVMIVWREDDIWCRSLVDWLSDDLRTVDDYKSTGMSVAPHVIGRLAEAGGWHFQMAWIERGLNALDPANAGRRRFRNIAQENYAPHAVTVMKHDEHWLTMGRKGMDHAVNIWRNAPHAGWPAYTNRTVTPEFPGYRENQFLNREMNGDFEPTPRSERLQSIMGG